MDKSVVRELKIHTASAGEIWASSWLDRKPELIARSPEELMESSIFKDSTSAVVVASRNNVKLINEIYLKTFNVSDYTLWVSSPAFFVGTVADLEDPVRILEAMYREEPCVAPSLGGWHVFNRMDYPSYAIASIVARDPSVPDHAMQFLRAHPAWPALSFIVGLNWKTVCRLLGIILDPRWYIDIEYPNRTSRLESFLGVNMKTQAAVSSLFKLVNPVDDGPEKITQELENRTEYEVRNIERCTIVQYCWWRQPDDMQELIVAGKGGTPQSHVSPLDLPGGFLWRIWESHGSSPKGVLRTSQQFLRFLRDTWLDAIYADTVGDRLFIPEYFFKSEFERLAFRAHMDSFNKK